MRIIAILLLVLFAGTMTYGIGATLLPLVRENIMLIAFSVYIAFSFIELLRGAYETFSVWHTATARLRGGFIVRARAVMTSSKLGAMGRARFALAIACELIAHAISWPLSWLARKASRRLSGENTPPRQPPRLALLCIYSFISLNAKALVVLLLCGLAYLSAAYAQMDALGLQLVFWLFIVFCNAVLLSQALSPTGIATALRQQPFSPTVQLSLLLTSISLILILSLTAIFHADSLLDTNALIDVASQVLKAPDPFEVWDRGDWSAPKVASLVSAALLSTVVIQVLMNHKSLKRTDADRLVIATHLINAGFIAQARHQIQQISTPTTDSLITSGIVNFLEGNLSSANSDFMDGLRWFYRDWPRQATEDELETLVLCTQLGTSAIPDDAINQALLKWRERPRRPIDLQRVSEALFVTGRMGTIRIREVLRPDPPLPFALADAALAFIDKRPSEASRALNTLPAPPVPGWRAADITAHIIWLLLAQQPWNHDAAPTLAAIHRWCSDYAVALDRAIQSTLNEKDVLGIVTCLGMLTACGDALRPVSPIDSNRIAKLVGECTAFLNSFPSGKILSDASSAAIAVARSGMHDHSDT